MAEYSRGGINWERDDDPSARIVARKGKPERILSSAEIQRLGRLNEES